MTESLVGARRVDRNSVVITECFRATGYRMRLAIDPPELFVNAAIALEWEMFAAGIATRDRKSFAGGDDGVGVVSEFAAATDR